MLELKRRESDTMTIKIQRVFTIVGVVLALVIALSTTASNMAITREVTEENRARIAHLEQKSVDKTELDKVEKRLVRIEDKLDRIIEKQTKH